MKYTTPNGNTYDLYNDALKQPHLLVAGATGSGKSVVINGIISSALYHAPGQKADCIQFILIDPKRVELSAYKKLPHVLRYASEPNTMIDALNYAMDVTEMRYKDMQKRNERKYSGGDVYVIIDEFADLMTTNRKNVMPLIQRLAQIGRAAKVHLIVATQTPIAKVLPTEIKCNFDCRIALRTRSAQDSRNIIEQKGCEVLPRYGYGVYMKPEETVLHEIPMVEEEEINRLIKHWEKQSSFFQRLRKVG